MSRTALPSGSRLSAAEARRNRLPDVFWLAYQALSEEDCDIFWTELLENNAIRGELLDTILSVERRGGPYHPEYETYLKELEEQRAAVKAKSRR